VNLIFNAVDSMPEGGRLTVRTGRILDAMGRQRVKVEIADTGSGMDEETRRRCLEPFFTTKGERGTGLGLAMVYGVVQRHGAELELDSVVGIGTIARIVFPAAAGDHQPHAPISVMPAVRNLRILVVDDDPLVMKALRDALEIDGHQVVSANGGQQGIDAFVESMSTQLPFAIVITDLGMPHVDGRKVSETIKTLSPGTPIVLLTGWGQRLVAEGTVPVHVDRVLNKPPKLPELRDALRALHAGVPVR
jgi:CheY-like chemotaxis protein